MKNLPLEIHPSAPGAARVMFIRAPKRLSPAQLATALGSMADDDPRWLAVHQILDEQLAGAMFDVTAPRSTNRDHSAGQAEALSTLKQRLFDERAKPAAPEKPRRNSAR